MRTDGQESTGGTEAFAGLPLSAVWAVAAVALPVILSTAAPLVTVDLTFLVRAGNEMLRTGHVLRTDDMLAWTLGHAWLNQQWGAEVILAGAYRVAGWLGLAALRALLATAVFLFVYLACRGAGAARRACAFLTFACAVILAGVLLRAQLFGMACFAATLWLASGRRTHPKRIWLAVVVEILWVNSHGSFFLGPLLFLFAWIEDRSRRAPDSRRTLVACGTLLLATLANPFGIKVWSYVTEVAANPLVLRAVTEWRPPSVRTVTGALFFISVVAVAAFLARRPGPTPWPTLLTLGAFFAIGLPAVRGTIWWELAAPVVVAGLLTTPARPRADPVSRVNTALAGGIVLIALLAFVRWLPYTGEEPPARHLLRFAPTGITNELRGLLAPGERFFNPQEWGSWFELELPDNPVIADSRFELMPSARWDEYAAISQGRQGWQKILDRWGITVAVLTPDQQEELIPLMRADPGWRLVYEDADGLIFTRA